TMKRESLGDGYERDLYGSLWRVDRRPFHLETPGLERPSFEGYDFPTSQQFVAPDFQQSTAAVVAEHGDSFTIVGIGWGLWENSWGIRGFENALSDCVAEPEFFEELVERLTDLYLAHIARCADIPADAIQMGDDWGDQRGVMIGPERWRRFLKPRYARLYEAVHAQGKFVIHHTCGSVADVMGDIVEIGLDVLESVQPEAEGMDPYQLKRQWGDHITFWGGLGSQSTIPFGTPESIHAEVDHLRREMGEGGGYILAPAKSLQPGTPMANAVAVVEAFTGRTS
ncbi:uroporphyrinogen decarboxylase family protein, partial [Candidatus Latescibacterota bacterium]